MSSLTASSKLQHLDVSVCTLPVWHEGVWQHMFPAGWQLLVLQRLYISYVKQSYFTSAAPPDGSLLVSCFPELQCLDMRGLQHSLSCWPL